MIGHLIDGRRVEGESAFEAPGPEGVHAWARASERDAARALAALEPGAPPSERLLIEAAGLVADDAAWSEVIAGTLLGDPAAALPERLGTVPAVRRQSGHRGSPTVTLLGAHWTDGAGELGRRLLGALASGAAVLVLSDQRLPDAADVWADALLDAGLPERRLALLHGADPRAVARLAGAPERARITVDDPDAAAAVRAAAGERRWALDWPRGRARRAGEAGCETPRAAVRSAFGRETLGGLLPGRTTVLEVPEREHAGWVEALVPEVDRLLERGGRRREPIPPIDTALRRRFEAAVRRLLEQGATPVAMAERRGEAAFAPALFVNGEPWMEPVKELPCLPLLVVRRVPDEAPVPGRGRARS